jgi:uncharacterized membrane protein YoaK (UPF0700 family)
MIQRLPKWVEVGSFVLALTAGIVNAIALVGFTHQGVSHLSGSSTLIGVELAGHHGREALHLLGVILCFLAGAAASGVIIAGESLKLGRHYGAVLGIETLLLVLSMLLLHQGSAAGHYLASAACGLQNAMTTSFGGAVIRTTHVTGLFTDLGITLGLKLRGQPVDKRRVVLYVTIIAGYLCGGWVGALLFVWLGFYSMGASAVLTGVLAVAYLFYGRHAQAEGGRLLGRHTNEAS